MPYVDGPRFAVEAKPAPVPELEGENIGGGADFEHHAVRARAMDGAGGDEKMVVPAGGPGHNITVGLKIALTPLGGLEIRHHGPGVHSVPEAQVYHGTLFGVHEIIALVLGVVHAEFFLDVLGEGMHLQAQVAAVDGVEKVETDGKLVAKAGVHRIAQQLNGVSENEIDGGDLDDVFIKFEQQAVFLRHTVETPGVIRGRRFQPEALLHPLSAPGAGIKKGHQAERTSCRFPESLHHRRSLDHFGLPRNIGVQQEVPPVKKRLLEPVAHSPVNEESLFV